MNTVSVVCKDCGKLFTITAKETQWYNEKGFALPKRCPECRRKNRAERKDK